MGFQSGVEDWQTYEGRDLRVHRSMARLVEISPVALRAYDGTSLGIKIFGVFGVFGDLAGRYVLRLVKDFQLVVDPITRMASNRQLSTAGTRSRGRCCWPT